MKKKKLRGIESSERAERGVSSRPISSRLKWEEKEIKRLYSQGREMGDAF